MTDLNVALILRMMDQFSGPAGKVRGAIKGLGDIAKEFRKSFAAEIRSGFSEANIEAALAKNEQAIAKARGRLMGAFGMGLTLAAPVIASGKMQEQLIAYGNLAGLTSDKLKALKADLDALGRDDKTGMGAAALLEGLQTYVGKGLDQGAAMAALLPTGRAAKAAKAEFNDMAASGFALMDNLKVAPELLGKTFDIMAQSGKEGSFELKDMARAFPEITAGARALGIEGVEGVASLSAALQIAMKSAGSADQAANNFSNFIGKITSPDAVAKFADFGVDVQAELNKAIAAGEDPLEHMLSVIQKITGGDQFKMGELFADKQVLDFLRAAIPNLEEYRRIKQSALSADGVIDADYANVMDGAIESTRQFKNAVSELLGAGGAVLPVFTDLTKTATALVYTLSDWTKEHPQLTEAIVKGGAALLAFGIGTRVLGYGFALFRGGLIRTVATFLKFDAAGRNVSIAAKAVRGLGFAIGGLWKLGKFSLSALIKPLRWTAKLIPKLPWGRLAGVLNWRVLVAPMRWSAALIGRIPWLLGGALKWTLLIPKLVWNKFVSKIFLSDFGPGITQIGPAMEAAAARTKVAAEAIQRSLSRIRFRAALGALQTFSTMQMLLSDAPDAKSNPEGFKKWQQDNAKHLDETLRGIWGLGSLMKGYDKAFEWVHGRPPPAPGSDAPVQPQSTPAVPPAPSSSADRILGGGLTREDLRAAAAQWQTPQVITRSDASGRSATPPSAAPVQRIEETVNHDYRSEQSITVTVPVQIMKQAEVDYGRIAREVGARTEAATRRALSDHGGPQ